MLADLLTKKNALTTSNVGRPLCLNLSNVNYVIY